MFLDDVTVIAKQVSDAISQVSSAAQVILVHGWEVYVRQQVFSGIENVVVNGVLLIIVLVSCGRFLPGLYSWAKNYKYKDYENDGVAYLLPGLLSVLSAFLLIVTLHNISDGVMHIINPEYYAIQEIVSQVKG